MNTTFRLVLLSTLAAAAGIALGVSHALEAAAPAKPSTAIKMIEQPKQSWPAPAGIGPGDWGQWGGSTIRNNTPEGQNIPTEWEPGEFDEDTGEWKKETSKNIKWVAKLGSQSYGNPVVANGQCYVGSNNGAGWLKRYPAEVDLGCLLAFKDADGSFLWQHSSEKLPTGRVHDWPLQGICCAPLVEGDRLWFVTSRGEVVCLDTAGFYDDENDGPFKSEKVTAKDEADAVWYFDMMKELGVSQHNMCSCSVTSAGDLLFVCTSNGVDESHVNIPAPAAPSFLCMDKHTGKVLWQDNSPGINVHHGQWSSPTYAVLGGVPQVLFPGGDGWLYSFQGEATPDGKPKLLWKFDSNPKEAKLILGGRGTRNDLIGTPVVYNGLVYVAVGQDPEHGEGEGHLWCIDPNKRGDVSPELAFNVKDLKHPIPYNRIQAVVKENGEVARPNPNSALIWHYASFDLDADGKTGFEESMHRTCGTVTIKDDILYLADFSGLFHCLDAKTGKLNWTYDMLAASWGSALVVDGKVYIGDEDGDVAVFKHSADKEAAEPMTEINMGNAVYSTPVVANNILYIANKTHLFAIQNTDGAVADAP
ncbi:MAG: PQQ-binding-like beta-propeller repeat protein [Pirellulales bacterium]|nr:PQQ-binding-like beta-propeller repeat protein [Pirellulales bacterium]